MLSLLLLLAMLIHPGHPTDVAGEFDTLYNVTVNSSSDFVIEFNHRHAEATAIRLTTGLVNPKADVGDDFPLQIVVRQQLIVQSWNLPLQIDERVNFSSVSRTLCSAEQDANTSHPITVQVTTFSKSNIEMEIIAQLLHNITVSIGEHYNIYITPSSPVYYEYIFDDSNAMRPVTLFIKSPQNYYCSTVFIQAARCPDISQIYSTNRIISQTFLQSAAVIIKKMPDANSVYIIFSVSSSEEACTGEESNALIEESKLKEIDFWIEGHIDDSVYVVAVLTALAYSMFFYVCTLFICLYIYLRNKRRGKEVKKTSQSQRLEERDIGEPAQPSATSAPTHSANETINPGELDSLTDDQVTTEDDSKQQKQRTMMSDMTVGDHRTLRTKYTLYFWNVMIISIFYGLPVIQLVFTYQQYLNRSGNQDTCYYNFQCARKFGVLYTFNNVFSNISYILLGILFMVIVRLRQEQHSKLSEIERTTLGIPQFFGLLYTMGWALMVEGIMSACYHICPSSNNFQFDTSFMYILGGMLALRLFQSRHPNINANANSAFFMLALIIMITVVGVLFNRPTFWYLFFFFYLLVILYMSLQIYYAGRFKLDSKLIHSLRVHIRDGGCKWTFPTYKAMFGLLAAINLINFGIALYGVVSKPEDFATFMLAIIMLNLFCYCVFYIIMKLFYKEKILPPSIILGVIATVLAGASLYLFTRYLTSWTTTPALSRNQNKDCFILDFYDTHDVWHFLSAGGIFCVFLVALYIDDDLQKVPRTKIHVF